MVEVVKLLEYNRDVRHRYFDALAKVPWEELVKNREASFHSIRNIFIHTLNATDFWLDFLLKEKLYVHRRFDTYESMEYIENYMTQVEARLELYTSRLDLQGLNAEYSVKNDAGETFTVTAEDVLIHIFEEEVHHRGELIGLLWQMGVEPPLMGWKDL
ncbi:MAG: DinB family protein [Candidatus Bathyarchaeota archaeon]|nr:DinB family protein [Candidatus Bathyarchaeota archaeon]